MKKKYLTFEDARIFVINLNLKTRKEWIIYCKSGEKPDNIPSNTDLVYKNNGWVDWGDFLGTFTVAPQNKEFLPFEDARKFVHKLKIKSWKVYCKSGEKPDNIPTYPDSLYKNKGWVDWFDWLNKSKPKFLSFENAVEFVHKLKLKSNRTWKEYCISGKKPDNIPNNPNIVYSEWVGWGKWLGNSFLSFKEARQFARKLNLKSKNEWIKYCISGKKPFNIPSNPCTFYNEWFDWYDWLDNIKVENKVKVYIPFNEAREFVHGLNFKSIRYWNDYRVSEFFPDNIPTDPRRYKDFINWGDWLGTGTVAHQNRYKLSFNEAREFARKLKLNSSTEWNVYCKSGKKPDNISASPNNTYKNKGWVDWGDWLGTFSIASQKHAKKYLKFGDARKFAHNLKLKNLREWNEYCKSGKKPDNIPNNPHTTYKNNGWIGVNDWLGTNNYVPFIHTYISKDDFEQFINDNFSNVHPEDMNKIYKKWWDENKPDNMPKKAIEYYNK